MHPAFQRVTFLLALFLGPQEMGQEEIWEEFGHPPPHDNKSFLPATDAFLFRVWAVRDPGLRQ